MNIRLKKLPESIRSTARYNLLAPEVFNSFLDLERYTGGLVYKDFWMCAVQSLIARRIHPSSLRPAYSPFNYGMSLALDLKEVKIEYEELLNIMKKHGWYCYRTD